MPLPGLSLSGSARSEASSAFTGRQDGTLKSGVGNRGFVNNFSATPAAWNPGAWTWILPLAAAAALFWWIRRK